MLFRNKTTLSGSGEGIVLGGKKILQLFGGDLAVFETVWDLDWDNSAPACLGPALGNITLSR